MSKTVNGGRIVQYIRDGRNQRIGVVVAILDADGNVSIGTSVCNKKDRFKKDLALEIALGRAEIGSNSTLPVRMVNRVVYLPEKMGNDNMVPHYVRVDAVAETVNKVRSRAKAYFGQVVSN